MGSGGTAVARSLASNGLAGGSTPQLSTRARTVCASANAYVVHGSQTWSPAKASSYIIGCNVEVGAGATLTIDPETIVKFGVNGLPSDIYVAPGGSLFVDGCPQPPRRPGHPPPPRVKCPKRPIIFTSTRDTSTGTPTLPRGLQASGNLQDVVMDGRASVYVDYADFRQVPGASVVAGDPLRIAGCSAMGADTLSIYGSTLTAPVNSGQCDSRAASHYTFRGDTLAMPATRPALSISGNPADTISIAGDDFAMGAVPAGQVVFPAISVSGMPVQGITLAGVGSDHFSSPARPVLVDLADGTVPAGTSWAFASPDSAELEGQITVAGAVQLDPGATLTGQAQLTVAGRGSLRAAGEAARPVRFSGGSWVLMTGGGGLALDHTDFSGPGEYAVGEDGCTARGHESVTVRSSVFFRPISIGSCNSEGYDRVDVTANRFEVPDGATALSVVLPGLSRQRFAGRLVVAANVFTPRSGVGLQAPEAFFYGWPVQQVALSGALSNRFLGNGPGRVVDVSAAEIPSASTWLVTTAAGAVLETQSDYFSHPGLEVQGRLVLAPGVTVKIGTGFARAGGIGVGYGIWLGDEGTLYADGTAKDRVVFTSMTDNTVGGDSSGARTVPTQHDYIWAVGAGEGSKVFVSHAVFRHGWYAFFADCSVAPKDGGTFTLTASELQAQVDLGDCDGSGHGYVPQLEGNVFAFNGAQSGQFAAGGGYDPRAFQPALLLFNIDPSGVALSGPATNLFSGSGAGRVVALAGTELPRGQSWAVSAASRAVIALWLDTDYLDRAGMTVDGSLTLGAGTVVKATSASVWTSPKMLT